MSATRWKDVVGHKYKKFHEEEYSNTIFSNEQIEVGKEDKTLIADIFTKPDKVYARSYFPKPVGKISGKDFYHELWIDKKLIKTTYFSNPPDPNWDQIQIWISEDEYKDELAALESGSHEVIIWVLKNVYVRVKNEWRKKRLSVGKFTYNVPEGMGGSGLSAIPPSKIDLLSYAEMSEDLTPDLGLNTPLTMSMLQEIISKVDGIKNDTELIIEYTSQIEEIFDKQTDLEAFLQDRLQSDFEKIKDSWQDYKEGKIGKKELIKVGLKSIGKVFVRQVFHKLNPI